MKKALAIFICIVILFSMSACQKMNPEVESALSSDINRYESLIITESDENSSDYEIVSSIESNTVDTSVDNSDASHTTASSDIQESSNSTTTTNEDNSYKDIVCTKITDFQQVGFSTKDSNITMFVTMPKDWKFEKTNGGYNIIKNSKNIGTVTTSIKTSSNKTVNVFTSQITTNNINVTHNIDQISAENTSYTRTFYYNYTAENSKNKNIFITIPYQEIDSSATYKMITEAKMVKASTSTNLGILQIEDNRNKILILGNSFINSSKIGKILQTMCGDTAYVEAHSRGYAHVETYTTDAQMMQSIRDGNYSVVFICGLYNQVSFDALQLMINACKESNTKLAVFPAHNENQQNIERVMSMYPETVFINWKAEIESLISTGIDVSHFCIPDSHKHSTPLAGYVGAHMIYRAVFNEIPTVTQFTDVSQAQISLLGEYTSTGIIKLVENSNSYIIE